MTTLITYLEFDVVLDHVSPPTVSGISDLSGLGTRIRTPLIGNFGTKRLDSHLYETSSLVASVEKKFDVATLSTRDAAVNNLGLAVHAMAAKCTYEHPAHKATPKKTTKEKTI